MKILALSVAAFTLTACGGSSVAYLGAVGARPDAEGVIAGVPEADYAIVRDAAGNGYALGFSIGADPDIFSDGNIAGSVANYAYSGILAGANVGDVPTVGTGRFSGRYDVVLVEGYNTTSDPRAWTMSEHGGPFSITVDFETTEINGESFDEALVVRQRAQSAEEQPSAPFAFGLGPDINLRFQGISGGVTSAEVGEDGVVAAFNGQNNSAFYAGGFVASAN